MLLSFLLPLLFPLLSHLHPHFTIRYPPPFLHGLLSTLLPPLLPSFFTSPANTSFPLLPFPAITFRALVTRTILLALPFPFFTPLLISPHFSLSFPHFLYLPFTHFSQITINFSTFPSPNFTLLYLLPLPSFSLASPTSRSSHPLISHFSLLLLFPLLPLHHFPSFSGSSPHPITATTSPPITSPHFSYSSSSDFPILPLHSFRSQV